MAPGRVPLACARHTFQFELRGRLTVPSSVGLALTQLRGKGIRNGKRAAYVNGRRLHLQLSALSPECSALIRSLLPLHLVPARNGISLRRERLDRSVECSTLERRLGTNDASLRQR